MPSKSAKQHRLMAMVAHDPKAAKRLGIPQSVGRDYVEADKGRKFNFGGDMKESKSMMRREVAFMKKKGAPKSMIRHEEKEMGGGKGKVKKFAGVKGSLVLPSDRSAGFRGMPGGGGGGSSSSSAMSPAQRSALGDFAKNAAIYGAGFAGGRLKPLATAAKFVKGAALGKQAYDVATMDDVPEAQLSPEPETPAIGNRRGGAIKAKKFASSGSASRRADGMAHKGKTKGKMVKMASGGMAYSGGGSVYRKGADGIASKGKTRGKIVKMNYGGKC